ncbi:hypothetical protein [Adhaeribacter soli]|uniref:hypothetical protein n=1 Tax=Adhaeribacter soli TaxID=2607655 RepID=UPI001CD9DD69|nr:hypothetical protein [Adhaeribacter soli]
MKINEHEFMEGPAALPFDLTVWKNPASLTEAPLPKKPASLNEFLNNLPDLICLSHLRWDLVYRRPQHLLTRFARHARIFYIEEPVFYANAKPHFNLTTRGENITVLVAHLPVHLSPEQAATIQQELLDSFLAEQGVTRFMLWYYTPVALEITRHLKPELTIYDCMDEPAASYPAPRLRELEIELFKKADVIFTGGRSLYEAKKSIHPEVYAFPSSIDFSHFAAAREYLPEPEDQQQIPFPRLGFFGVIDERFDAELLGELATARPDWQFVIIGPVVNRAPETLP